MPDLPTLPDDVGEPTRREFNILITRMRNNSDKINELTMSLAEAKGRLGSAEASIDRMIKASATTEQLVNASTILSLKLDHLLEKQLDMKWQITKAQRWVFVIVGCWICALIYWALFGR